MTVKILKGTVHRDGSEYNAGKTLDVDDKEAASLIALGMAKKAGTSPAAAAPSGEQKKGGDK